MNMGTIGMTTIIEEVRAYSVDKFCAAHSISRSFFYELLKGGKAPRIFKAGHRTLISREAADEWRNTQSKKPEGPK